MRRTTLYYNSSIVLLLVALLVGACTRNHGDIGMWFGTWHVEAITVDDSQPTLVGDYFFQFQSHVFRVSQVYGHEQLVASYGTWEESDDARLTVAFPDASVFYISMPGLEAFNDFTVESRPHGRVLLTRVTSHGETVTYMLKKQP